MLLLLSAGDDAPCGRRACCLSCSSKEDGGGVHLLMGPFPARKMARWGRLAICCWVARLIDQSRGSCSSSIPLIASSSSSSSSLSKLGDEISALQEHGDLLVSPAGELGRWRKDLDMEGGGERWRAEEDGGRRRLENPICCCRWERRLGILICCCRRERGRRRCLCSGDFKF